jgi:hypothetical protein
VILAANAGVLQPHLRIAGLKKRRVELVEWSRQSGRGGSLGTFVCVQPVKILRNDLIQRHVHICAGAVSTGAKGRGQDIARLFERLESIGHTGWTGGAMVNSRRLTRVIVFVDSQRCGCVLTNLPVSLFHSVSHRTG